jgi:acyl-CoA synthetase (AMP-forming)/AMP-acid ligase II
MSGVETRADNEMTSDLSVPRALATTWVTAEIRQEFEDAGWWTSQRCIDRLVEHTAADPQAIAVVDEQAAMTRGEVWDSATKLATYLRRQGVKRGDVITVVVPNWREFAVIHAAIGLIGGVLNPLLPKVGRPEMVHIMSTAQSRFVFVAETGAASSPFPVAQAAASEVPSVLGLMSVRGDSISLESILAAEAPVPDFDRDMVRSSDDWDTVTFTSGTEALPKGVVHTHQSTMFGLRAYVNDVLGLTAADRVFMPSPIGHASGLQWGLRTAAFLGVPLILQDRWDASRALNLIDTHGCTFTMAATPFIVDLIEAKRKGEGSGTTLRYIASGGTTVPRRLVGETRETFSAELLAVFGSSETYVTTSTRPGSPDSLLASDGAALPGVQVAITDEEGNPVPDGDEGEIVTRGPQLFLGYLGDRALTERTFRGEWYRFGDLGRIDSDGMLHVTGRIKDIIIRGGENISAREVEEVLIGHPAVRACAVVGYPDPRLGERSCAVVVSDDSELDLGSLTSYLLERGLAKYKLPERLAIVTSLPMTSTGKIRKVELRRQLAEVPA